jgi:hypothetical protein
VPPASQPSAAPAPQPPTGPVPSQARAVGEDAALLATLPHRIAKLRRQGPVQDAPRGEPGALLAFARQDVAAAIILSNPSGLPVPEGPTSTLARGTLAEATGEASIRLLEDATSRSRGAPGRSPAELRWRSFVLHDGNATDLLCNRATLPANRRLVTEVVCVTGVAGRMMTVGVTVAHDRKGAEEAVRLACRFAAAARAALRQTGRAERT